MKLAIIDLDGVVADATARFAKAEEVKQAHIERVSNELYAADEREATNVYWHAVFNPEYVPMDALIDGVKEALEAIRFEHYELFFLTSRPKSMSQATIQWLFENNILFYLPMGQLPLVMKAGAFQYTKTTVWKAGMVQTLASLYSGTQVLVIDDEQSNLDEIVKHATVPPVVPGLMIAKSLAEAVAKLNGTWVEPDPFLPPE